MKAMGQNSNSLLGWLCGIGGGFTKMYLLQVGPDVPFGIKLFQAVITALLCGLAGAAGTHIFKSIIKKKKV